MLRRSFLQRLKDDVIYISNEYMSQVVSPFDSINAIASSRDVKIFTRQCAVSGRSPRQDYSATPTAPRQ
jgi:hypothetical protein